MTASRLILGLLAPALLAAPIGAADPAMPRQAKINEAIARGGEYLRTTHAPAQGYQGGSHGVATAALAGMGMLEAGVQRDDPSLQNVLQFVRAGALQQTQTYHVVLAILFLDRFGEQVDSPAIQLLGARLYASQTASGGWGYTVTGPAGPELTQLMAAPQKRAELKGTNGPKPKADNGFPQAEKTDKGPIQFKGGGRLHPVPNEYMQLARQSSGRVDGPSDNSNTQFGLIGLWVAARHGVPAEDAFARIDARFLTSQNADAGWSYNSGTGGQSTVSMTCAGLLGLAVGAARSHGPAKPAAAPAKPAGTENDPFFNPGKAAGEKGKPDPKDALTAARKRAVDGALTQIGNAIRANNKNANGIGTIYYMLWSIERVAVAYNLQTIGGTDWYSWGCDYLLENQQQDGSWSEGGGGEKEVNTPFAILFLARSNYVSDLTSKIASQIKDPGKVELRGDKEKLPLLGTGSSAGTGGGGNAPSAPGGVASGGAAPGGVPGGTSPQPPAAVTPTPTPAPSLIPPGTSGAGGDPSPLAPVPVPGGGPSDAIASGLVAAGADWDEKLRQAKDGKGADYTHGLVRAIPQIDGARQKQAREALAERLTRMTASTLRTMLKDPAAELRRGACLACAMKDDKSHVPDLIDKLTDSSDVVVRAARAGLKSLTEKDFGPAPNADEPAKAKAAAVWRQWYETEGRR
ncbi:HEAT repeat domain-containing protein [Fimbriiglobus ruber]|uniref:Uncharacterized protein n=1 Tax=Fimbriiglobus ruber TaxID=1908690 RepID=A0A225DA90_9BACT|nr:HEAT repeat domain-containing protein [Fimbriiglobus ruber]OWK38510.1 hypothetical protein FRUB_07630 [Fimbriiglobus ruber]